jgi:hypothetical protein
MLTTLRAALPGRGSDMPSDTLTRSVAIDGDHLARYAHGCGFPLSDRVPATFPHVLAHPLFLELLAASPFSAVGVVHIGNRIVQHRPLVRGEELELRVKAGPFAPHRRGRTFDFVSEAFVDGELVWEDFSTMLKRGGGDDTLPREEPAPEPPVTAHWRVADDTGRRYAAVSGDHNPIHLHGLAAKAFGFPRAIAHGMWTKARCLSALRLGDSFEVSVRFVRPVLLPSSVTFGEADGAFAVHGHLEGAWQDRRTSTAQ